MHSMPEASSQAGRRAAQAVEGAELFWGQARTRKHSLQNE